MSQEPEQEGKRVEVTEENLITILKHLMRLYADAHDLDTQQMCSVKIQEFVEWCTANEHPICPEDMTEITASLQGVGEDVLEFIWACFQNPYAACQILQPLWPALVLSGQPPCKHQPVCFLLAFTAMFDDHTVLQMQAQTPWDPKRPITDGFLCSLLLAQMGNMINMTGHIGLDELWAKYAQPLPERMQGDIRKVIVPHGVNKLPEAPEGNHG